MKCVDCGEELHLGIGHPSTYCLEMKLRSEIHVLKLQLSELQTNLVVGGMPVPGLICVAEAPFVKSLQEFRDLELQIDALREELEEKAQERQRWIKEKHDAERLNGEMLTAIREAVELLHEKPREEAVARLMAVLSKTEKQECEHCTMPGGKHSEKCCRDTEKRIESSQILATDGSCDPKRQGFSPGAWPGCEIRIGDPVYSPKKGDRYQTHSYIREWDGSQWITLPLPQEKRVEPSQNPDPTTRPRCPKCQRPSLLPFGPDGVCVHCDP